jgi:Asp-tRNA(Asn)/Glu-tRNA(Gln) amidotransferase A subunit family amidase
VTDVCRLSALELRAALTRRELSAAEALEAVLDRADAIEGPLNPFAVRLDDRARRAAAKADAALARGDAGPLCGLPLTIKDSHWLAGVTSAVGSHALADFVPHETSAAVERLEAAGAVIYAKTTTPEFCYFGITESPLNGRTSNPWNVARTPGGSSGGAAAALAAGAGPLALGGDGGGSIRIPSAFCGLVGFKPTFGLVAREPCSPAWK